jgi:hypothetical protein
MKSHSCLVVCYYHTVTSCVQGETLNPMTANAPQWDEERPVLLGEFQTQVAQRPVDNSNYGAWLLGLAVCLEFPNPDELTSTMVCCCPCLHFPKTTLNWESWNTKQGHLPPASSIVWLDCHSNRPGRSMVWTLPVPVDVGWLWHHNQVFSDWSHCVTTPTKPPSHPHTRHFGASNRQDLLIWRWLISANFPPHLFKVQLRWHSLLFHTTTSFEAAYWRLGSVSTGEYDNTSSPLQGNQTEKVP